MSEFINEFGKENFYILVSIVFVILIILLLIIIFEKRSAKKALKEEIQNIDEKPVSNEKPVPTTNVHKEER